MAPSKKRKSKAGRNISIELPKSLPRRSQVKRTSPNQVKVYIDTSLALDYYLAVGSEWPDDHFIDSRSDYNKAEQGLWEDLLKDDKRLTRATRLRKIVSWDYDSEALMVISPLVLLEMQEWIAADAIKRGLLTVTHIKRVQSLSVSEIGELAKRLWDSGSGQPDGCRRDWAYALFHSPIAHEGLVGIDIEEIPGLTVSERRFNKIVPLAVYQLGLADIIHLLAARRLGCTHFATTDSGFKRARELMAEELKLHLLFGDEVFNVVKPKRLPGGSSSEHPN
jgi:hypothetical protein